MANPTSREMYYKINTSIEKFLFGQVPDAYALMHLEPIISRNEVVIPMETALHGETFGKFTVSRGGENESWSEVKFFQEKSEITVDHIDQCKSQLGFIGMVLRDLRWS